MSLVSFDMCSSQLKHRYFQTVLRPAYAQAVTMATPRESRCVGCNTAMLSTALNDNQHCLACSTPAGRCVGCKVALRAAWPSRLCSRCQHIIGPGDQVTLNDEHLWIPCMGCQREVLRGALSYDQLCMECSAPPSLCTRCTVNIPAHWSYRLCRRCQQPKRHLFREWTFCQLCRNKVVYRAINIEHECLECSAPQGLCALCNGLLPANWAYRLCETCHTRRFSAEPPPAQLQFVSCDICARLVCDTALCPARCLRCRQLNNRPTCSSCNEILTSSRRTTGLCQACSNAEIAAGCREWDLHKSQQGIVGSSHEELAEQAESEIRTVDPALFADEYASATSDTERRQEADAEPQAASPPPTKRHRGENRTRTAQRGLPPAGTEGGGTGTPCMIE